MDAEKVTRGETLYVGVSALSLLETLTTKKIYPRSTAAAISDEWVLHALRDKKVKPLPVSFWEGMPELLQEPEQILLGKAGRNDDVKQSLVFVYPSPVDKGKLVVTLDYDVKTRHSSTGKKEHLILSTVNIDMIAEMDKQVDNPLYRYETIWRKP